MALSRVAAQHAAEIKMQDWSDAPFRADKAGHNRDDDGRSRSGTVLTPEQTDRVRMNVMWVTAQVLAYNDPNFNVHEFAGACGVNVRNKDGRLSGGITHGLRFTTDGRFHRPGTYSPAEVEPVDEQGYRLVHDPAGDLWRLYDVAGVLLGQMDDMVRSSEMASAEAARLWASSVLAPRHSQTAVRWIRRHGTATVEYAGW